MNNKERGKLIRASILNAVRCQQTGISKLIADEFGISPQAANSHIHKLIESGWLAMSGTKRTRRYFLGDRRTHSGLFSLTGSIAEDAVWRNDFAFVFDSLPENVLDICHYGFTEMLNNVIDHSGGKQVFIVANRDENEIRIIIADDGEGIFKKITRIAELEDERQALLELSKGKLTTDPDNHSGEGIFFTSRIFDRFVINSKGLIFSHQNSSEYDLIQEVNMAEEDIGTMVVMSTSPNTDKSLKTVFDSFTDGPDDFKFNKTIIPVRMAQYGNEKLISRSQAKRMLNRVEKFHWVVFDFEGVTTIGQGFADEIFRVYASKHPHIKLSPINMSPDVEMMVNRAM